MNEFPSLRGRWKVIPSFLTGLCYGMSSRLGLVGYALDVDNPRILDTQDEFTQLKAAQILTVLLWYEMSGLPHWRISILPMCAVQSRLSCNTHNYTHSSVLWPAWFKETHLTNAMLPFNVWKLFSLDQNHDKLCGLYQGSSQGNYRHSYSLVAHLPFGQICRDTET